VDGEGRRRVRNGRVDVAATGRRRGSRLPAMRRSTHNRPWRNDQSSSTRKNYQGVCCSACASCLAQSGGKMDRMQGSAANEKENPPLPPPPAARAKATAPSFSLLFPWRPRFVRRAWSRRVRGSPVGRVYEGGEGLSWVLLRARGACQNKQASRARSVAIVGSRQSAVGSRRISGKSNAPLSSLEHHTTNRRVPIFQVRRSPSRARTQARACS
jgi:hypothetical protein